MKNKILIMLSVFAGVFAFISCDPDLGKGIVSEAYFYQRALKIDSIQLQERADEIISEMKQKGCDSIPEEENTGMEPQKTTQAKNDQGVALENVLENSDPEGSCANLREEWNKVQTEIANNLDELAIAAEVEDPPLGGETGPPCPVTGECTLLKFKGILVRDIYKKINFSFFNEQGESIKGVEKVQEMEKLGLKIYFVNQDLTGKINVQVDKTFLDSDRRVEYGFQVKLPEEPKN